MERPNIIDIKESTFLSKKEHNSVSDSSNKTCHYCGKTFLYNSSLLKHERIHTGEKPYECDVDNCSQKFSQISNLIRHKKTHDGEQKTFTCKICNKNISSISNLKQHENIHKNSVTRVNFFCIIHKCNKSFLYVCTLKKHIQKDHQEEYKRILEYFPGNERNFSVIYKYLISKPETFPFIRIKNFSKPQSKSNGQSPEEREQAAINKEISFLREGLQQQVPQQASAFNQQNTLNQSQTYIANFNGNLNQQSLNLNLLAKYLEFAKSYNQLLNPLNSLLSNFNNNFNTNLLFGRQSLPPMQNYNDLNVHNNVLPQLLNNSGFTLNDVTSVILSLANNLK